MQKKFKATAAAMIGNALEYYDVMLYGFFAILLAPLFFPTTDPTIATISSFGTFAAGFIMRPLGGIVFGHIGDKFGRRNALVWAIFLVTIPTLVIGLLPTYAMIGIAAPIILIICRLLQGLCVGGEYSGASIFVIEYAAKGREAFAGSILCAAGFFGSLIGTLLGYISTLPSMPSWSWRIPFIVGAMIGLFGYYMRRQVGESPAFLKHKDDNIDKVPLLEVFKLSKRKVLSALGVGATSLIPFYMASVYMGYVLTTKLHVATSDVMLINVGLSITIMFLLPVMGLLADKIGKKNLMLAASTFSIVFAYPLFRMIEDDFSIAHVLIVQMALCFITAGFGAPSIALLSSLFPVNQRYSGIGFGYALGGALFGGTTPLILATLTGWYHPTVAHTGYLMFSGLMGIAAVLLGKQYKD